MQRQRICGGAAVQVSRGGGRWAPAPLAATLCAARPLALDSSASGATMPCPLACPRCMQLVSPLPHTTAKCPAWIGTCLSPPCCACCAVRAVLCCALFAEGGTALIYDWERNALEAIFNVPPNWCAQHPGLGWVCPWLVLMLGRRAEAIFNVPPNWCGGRAATSAVLRSRLTVAGLPGAALRSGLAADPVWSVCPPAEVGLEAAAACRPTGVAVGAATSAACVVPF